MNNLYLVDIFDDSPTLFNAFSVKDCVLLVAEYTGDDSQLFRAALRGCETDLECVQMYNKFSGYGIKNIYKVSEICYAEK